jgi:hypothetical protein
LLTTAIMLTALLAALILRLIQLPAIAGFAAHLTAHMIAVLNHEFTACAVSVSVLCHNELLSSRPGPHQR